MKKKLNIIGAILLSVSLLAGSYTASGKASDEVIIKDINCKRQIIRLVAF